jgi:sugar lactone lactonase YvrE
MKRRAPGPVTLCGLIAALALAGCGGGGGSNAAPAASGSSTSSSSGASSTSSSSGASSSGASSSSGGATSVTVGGSISGLTAQGLVLLNNGGDATNVPVNATSFTMNTAVASGSSYQITVGTQPYGISLACTSSTASGTASSNVTSVAITCNSVTPTQRAVKSFLSGAFGVAADNAGNLFVSTSDILKKIPYANGAYGTPTIVSTSLLGPADVTLDAQGNLYVIESLVGSITKFPFANGSFGTPVTVASSLGIDIGHGQLIGPSYLAIDANGNVFTTRTNAGALVKIPYSNGSYGNPIALIATNDVTTGVAVDANDNVFVADNGSIEELVFAHGSYAAPVGLLGNVANTGGIVLDAAGNLYVASNDAVTELPSSGGYSGAPLTFSTTDAAPNGLAMDSSGNLFVASESDPIALTEVPHQSSGYGAPVGLEAPLRQPMGVTVDAGGNIFVADTGNNALKEVAYNVDGTYAAPATVTSGSTIQYVAVDTARNLFFTDGNTLTEIPFSSNAYGSPSAIVTGPGIDFFLEGVTLDASGNLYVAATAPSSALTKIPNVSGTYDWSSAITFASGSSLGLSYGVAVDAAGNVFSGNASYGGVYEFPYSNGTYGAQAFIGPTSGSYPYDLAVDGNGNIFVADYFVGLQEIPLINGVYGAPISIGSGYNRAQGVAVDTHGQVYVVDSGNIWLLSAR